jgi:phospholipase C
MDGVHGGEQLVKQVYEALRTSPLWPSSLLIVTYDEHGGFYDHVAPGPAVPPGDVQVTPGTLNVNGFTFNQLGVRVPAVVVSPYIPQNLIDHRPYEHASIPATVEDVFGVEPLTARDSAASSVASLLQLTTPRPCPTTLPEPVPPAAAAALAVDADDLEPLTAGNLVGFVYAAGRAEIAMAPDSEREGILAKLRAITTRGEARRYIEGVAARVREAKDPTTGVAPERPRPV